MMEMDDATLLQMTKTRLSNLRLQVSNLQKFALKCIARNYRFYAKNQIQEQNLECLPKPLRNKVLEELSDHFLISEPCSTPGEMNVRVDIFKRLVNSRTLKIDLTGFMFCHKDRINLQKLLKKLLEVLVDNAPNLEELTIKECGKRELLNTKEMSVKFSQLRMLKSLKMPSHFTFESFNDLGKVCRNLPNLQIIWASVGCMHRVPNLQYLESCFPSLIVHYIKEFNNRTRFKQLEFLLDEICCRNAKRLEIVGKTKSRIFLEGINKDSDSITERTIYTGTPGQFRKVTIEMEEETREDTIVGKKYNRYYEEDWEHLTDCMVTVDEKKESQEDSRFNCVRFVDGGYYFRRALNVYQTPCWQNVQTISVENLTQFRSRPLELSLIAERCPNLERLIIKAGYCTIYPELNLSSLRDLELETSLLDQLSSLSYLLLAAPNLERVRLGVYEGDLTVNPIVPTSMIVDGRILRNLQKLKIVLRGIQLDPSYNDQILEEKLYQVIKLIKTASAYLPRLTEIKLTTMDFYGRKMQFMRRQKACNNINEENVRDGPNLYDFLDAFR